MKKTNLVIGLIVLSVGSLVLSNCNNKTKTNENYGGDTTKIQGCLADSSWFPHSQTHDPAEGADSPFANAKTTSNCDFHQWAWQKFLYLTRDSSSQNSILNLHDYVQVNSKMDTLGSTIILDNTLQAGSHSTLFDKKNMPVYYSVFMNKVMYNFSTEYLKLIVSNCKVNSDSINQNKLSSLGYDTITYPVHSSEIKISWILASSLDSNDLKEYYITKGKLKSTGKMVDIALIGMHIVGRVENHPEFIWATFEHNKLAPYAQWPANFAKDSTPNPQQVLSNANSLFYNAGLILDSCSVRPYSATHPNPPKNTFRSTYHLYQNGTQPQSANMILRDQDSTNQVNIQSINKSVAAHLEKEKGPWKNYEYVGAVWIDPIVSKLTSGDGNIGGLDRKNLRGSRANTNVTMETFAQLDWSYPAPGATDNGNTNPANSMNCFGCHATANFLVNPTNGSNYNMALSHLFNNRLAALLKSKKQTSTFLNHKKK